MRIAKLIAIAVALMLPAIARGATSMSLDEIHAALAHDGEWIDDARWGSVWSPHDSFFRPYSLGHWTVDGAEWTYRGASAWGDLTAHYGHWIDDDLYGWVWKPDGRWRAARVAWRMGDGLVGWAPVDPDGDAPKNAFDWVFVKGVDAVAEKLAVVRLPPIASVDAFGKTQPLTSPPTELAVLGLPDPSQPRLGDDRLASTDRTTM